jgi:RHS repeat-associated protein
MNGPVLYPFIAEKLAFILEHEVYAGVNNVIDRPIYLPEIDIANGKTIDPTRNTTVTSSALPGAKVEVAASTLMNQQGTPFTGVLSMTEVPASLTPAALPEGLLADLVVTIQPGEMVFTRPTPLSLPNRGGYAPGTLMDLWSINPITGEFDKVGTGQVDGNGAVIDTISGGIRNSSWHLFVPPPSLTGPNVKDDPRNKQPAACSFTRQATSVCEMHSGALLETHDLVSYMSQGVARGLTLTYDSLRVDPRPIVHFTFDDLNSNIFAIPSSARLIAELEVTRDGFSRHTPGFVGNAYGLKGSENIWRMPERLSSIDAALQVDLRDQPSGVYDYSLRSGVLGYSGLLKSFVGTLNSTKGQVTSVNTIGSELGAGWGISGLYELVENFDGSVLVINGDGSELLFSNNNSGGFNPPPGVFATLSKLPNGTFQRRWLDQTVEQYNSKNKLSTITDRNGNLTRYDYDNFGRIRKITDPVGLETTFAYSPGSIEIIDPVARRTRLDLDGQGNLIKVTDPDGSSRRWRYDGQHRMVGETDQLGNVEIANYGSHGRLTDVVRKDGSTRRYSPLDIQGLFPPEQTAADPIVTPLSNPLAGRIPLPVATFVDTNGNVTRSTLDIRGQVASSSDSIGPLSGTVRNADNLPVQMTNANGNATLFTYDTNGSVLTQSEELSENQRPFGTALQLDGVNERVVIADAPSLRPKDVTIESWVKLDSVDRSFTILSKLRASGDNGFSYNFTSFQLFFESGQLVSSLSDGSRFDLNKIPWEPAIGRWYHVALTFDDATNTLTVYVDGVPVSVGMVTLSIDYAPFPLLIGAGLSSSGTGKFPGAIDEVRVWNVARTGAQIRSGMYRVPLANEDGLVASYSFDEPSGTLVVDSTSNQNHGALMSNAPLYVGSDIEKKKAVPPPPGLVGWWSADGHSNDLVTGNNGEIRDYTSFAPGAIGLGFLFAQNGAVYNRVRIEDAPNGSLDVAGDITINAWVNPIPTPGETIRTPRTIVQKRSLSVDGPISYSLFLETDGRLTFTSQEAGGILRSVSTIAIVRGKKWSHIAVTISRETLLFYIDGSEVSAVPYPFPRQASDGPVTIGASQNRNRFEDSVDHFRGVIDELQLFNRALTSQEIRAIANADRAGQSKPTVFDAASDFSLSSNPNGSWEYGSSTVPGAEFTRLSTKLSEDNNILGLAETNFVYRARSRVTDIFSKTIATGNRIDNQQSKADSLTLRIASGGRNGVVQWTAPQAGTYRINGRFEGLGGESFDNADVNILLNNNTAAPLASGAVFGRGSQLRFSVTRVLSAGERLQFTVGYSGRNTLNYIGLSATILLEGNAAEDNGTATTTYTYDTNFNQLTSITDEIGRKTLFAIDAANGNTVSITNVVGNLGGNDDRVTLITYTASGQIDTRANALGQVTKFEYDSLGRVTKTRDAVGTVNEVSRQFEYDAVGRVTAVEDENGNRTRFDFDVMNRLTKVTQADGTVSSFTYDLRGNQRSSTNGTGNTQSQTYDSLDRIVRQTDAAGNATRYAFDLAGNLSSVTDPLNQTVRYQYDARRRTLSESDAANSVTRIKYDVVDRWTSIQDARGNKTAYTYDSLGRLTKMTDPLGKSSIYKYDMADQLLEATDRNGRVTRFSYNDLGERVTEEWLNPDLSPTNLVRYAYDPIGDLTQANDNFSSITFTRDALNRVQQEQTAGPNGIPTSFLNFTYDAVGNVLTQSDTINSVIGATNTSTFDSVNRVTQLVQAGTGFATKRVNFAYNELGQSTSMSRFADSAGQLPVVASNFSYDTLNRLTSILHRNLANSVLNSFGYQYDVAGRITQITDIDGATNYAYDKRDELTAATHADPSNPDEFYSYDATGNRKTSHLHGSSYVVGSGVAGTVDVNRLASDGKFNYTYDANGNLTKRVEIVSGKVREFSFDHRNRLVQITDRPSAVGAATQVVKYTYDLQNRRIASNVDTTPADANDGKVTYYVYAGEDVIAELTDPDGSGSASPAISMRYLYGPSVDQVLAQESASGEVQWMLTDHLGTVRDLVNNGGHVANHIKYDSYGNVVSESNPAVKTRYKYTGREFDSETGVQYNRARYYDAETGRFLSEDPIGFAGGDANLYRYVSNIPIDSTDPNGLKKKEQGEPAWKKINNAITWGKGIYNSGKEKITSAFDWIDYAQDRNDDFQKIRNEQKLSDFQRVNSYELNDQWTERTNETDCENPNAMRFKRAIKAVQLITEQIQKKLQEFADNSLLGKLFAKKKQADDLLAKSRGSR